MNQISRQIPACLIATSVLLNNWLYAETPVVDQATRSTPQTDVKPTSLFNGQNLEGWSGDPRLWSVRDGVIHGETTAENRAKGNTFLIWQGGQPADFELRLSFRCSTTNNSGVQYRSEQLASKSAQNKWVVRGYQHEIRNQEKLPNVAGFLYGEKLGRGRICLVGEKAVIEDGKKKVLETLITDQEFSELFRLDDWNEVVIRCEGRNVRHYLNGRLILDFTDSPELARREGVIALQLHAGKPMWAEFKKISLHSID